MRNASHLDKGHTLYRLLENLSEQDIERPEEIGVAELF